MPEPSTEAITALLRELGGGEPSAAERLFPVVYDELRGIASRYLRNERSHHTLQTTALVHEAYLKLVGQREVEWTDRAHFRAVAAMAIRRILLDYARTKSTVKRGSGQRRVPLEDVDDLLEQAPETLVAVDEALAKLEGFDARKAKVVELRFFAGLSIEESAEVLGVSHGTIERDWKTARAWLQAELAGS